YSKSTNVKPCESLIKNTVNNCTREGCHHGESFSPQHKRLIPRLLDYGRDLQLPVKPQHAGQPHSESLCVHQHCCSFLRGRKEDTSRFSMNLFCFSLEGSTDSLYEAPQPNPGPTPWSPVWGESEPCVGPVGSS
ncbi:uncharacterized protein LOC117599375, partial [Tachysurus ichikawai]